MGQLPNFDMTIRQGEMMNRRFNYMPTSRQYSNTSAYPGGGRRNPDDDEENQSGQMPAYPGAPLQNINQSYGQRTAVMDSNDQLAGLARNQFHQGQVAAVQTAMQPQNLAPYQADPNNLHAAQQELGYQPGGTHMMTDATGTGPVASAPPQENLDTSSNKESVDPAGREIMGRHKMNLELAQNYASKNGMALEHLQAARAAANGDKTALDKFNDDLQHSDPDSQQRMQASMTKAQDLVKNKAAEVDDLGGLKYLDQSQKDLNAYNSAHGGKLSPDRAQGTLAQDDPRLASIERRNAADQARAQYAAGPAGGTLADAQDQTNQANARGVTVSAMQGQRLAASQQQTAQQEDAKDREAWRIGMMNGSVPLYPGQKLSADGRNQNQQDPPMSAKEQDLEEQRKQKAADDIDVAKYNQQNPTHWYNPSTWGTPAFQRHDLYPGQKYQGPSQSLQQQGAQGQQYPGPMAPQAPPIPQQPTAFSGGTPFAGVRIGGWGNSGNQAQQQSSDQMGNAYPGAPLPQSRQYANASSATPRNPMAQAGHSGQMGGLPRATQQGTRIDGRTAMMYLRAAGNNPALAQQMARQNGWGL